MDVGGAGSDVSDSCCLFRCSLRAGPLRSVASVCGVFGALVVAEVGDDRVARLRGHPVSRGRAAEFAPFVAIWVNHLGGALSHFK